MAGAIQTEDVVANSTRVGQSAVIANTSAFVLPRRPVAPARWPTGRVSELIPLVPYAFTVTSEAICTLARVATGQLALGRLNTFTNSLVVSFLRVSIKSSNLQYRFDSKRMPELKTKAIAAKVPSDQTNKLKSRDSEILATALVYKAQRLTTYDPFLIFLGKEYITPETGLVIGPPDSSWLNFDQASSEA